MEVEKNALYIDDVKEILKKQHPELSNQIDDGDCMYICNRFLQNDMNRSEMAGLLGFDAVKCNICVREPKGDECSNFSYPLNICREGIMRWLETEKQNGLHED